jgi:hypothetical protein
VLASTGPLTEVSGVGRAWNFTESSLPAALGEQ